MISLVPDDSKSRICILAVTDKSALHSLFNAIGSRLVKFDMNMDDDGITHLTLVFEPLKEIITPDIKS